MKRFAPLSLTLILILLVACGAQKSRTLESFYSDEKIEQVNKITIQDGSTGTTKEITEQAQIDEFLVLIKDIEFTPQDNQEKRVGWRYRMTLFDFDNEAEFAFTTDQIDGVYYDTNQNILRIVDEYYQQLEIDGK